METLSFAFISIGFGWLYIVRWSRNDISLLTRGTSESRAMGQPITLAKRMILGPAATWRYYAGFAGKVAGESYPPDEDGTYKIVQYEPLGKLILASRWSVN